MKRVTDGLRGFTLIELIIVIAIIGILATISIIGFGRYQTETRDARRASSASVIAEALEKYYDANGEYPSCRAVTSATVANDTLKGINSNTIIAPEAPSGTNNSIECTSDGNSLTVNGTDFFEYQGDGSPDCAGSGSCLNFILKYRDEADSQIKSIASRRSTNVNTSGTVALTTGPVTYTTAIINWAAIPNAAGYVIQRDTVTTFDSGNLLTTPVDQNTTSYQFTDLAPGVVQYYRVQTVSNSGNGNWSNTVQQTPTSLPTLSLTNTQNTPSQVTESWSVASGSVTYTIQRAAASDFSGSVDTAQGSFTSKTYSDTPVATARYYRVQVNTKNSTGATFSGPWTTITYTTFVPAPSAPGVTASINGTNAVGVAGTATCTQGATIWYAIHETHKANSGGADNWSALTAWTTTPPTLTVAALQGNQHTFQAAAICIYSGVNSATTYGATSSTVRGINTPTTPTWPSGLSKTWTSGTYGHYMWYGTYCPDGTWVNQTWFHSRPWASANGSDFYHTFGFNDYWLLGPSGGANVEYWAMYTCISSYAAESPWTSQSYDVIWVAP